MTIFDYYYRLLPWFVSGFFFLMGIFEKHSEKSCAMLLSAVILLATACVIEAIHKSREVKR